MQRSLRSVLELTISLAALATGRVEESVTHVLVDSERFTSNGRLITGENRKTVMLVIFIFVFAVSLVMLLGVIGIFVLELLPFFETFRCVVVADQRSVAGNDSAFLGDDLCRH